MIRQRILLVEDEPGLRRTLTDLLLNEGYVVESSGDGLKGQELALKGDFDLIVLDVMLPSRSGFDVCTHLRKNNIAVPILMLTARSELNNKVQGFKVGADDYLTKPFEAPEF
jgi:DNA-binding response OmpR family regulator